MMRDMALDCTGGAAMEVHPVETRADLRRFVELPYRLYRRDPIWVPPLRSEQWAQFNPQRNPMLDHCDYTLFLLLDGGRPVGRVAAFVDSLAVEHWQRPIGLFGSFECAADAKNAHLLLQAASNWLTQRGMARMRGPWSFASQEWGLLYEGFTPSPPLMAPHNPFIYNDFMTSFGLAKVKDLLAYDIDVRQGYAFPERYLTLTDRVQQRYGVTIRQVDLKHLDRDVATLMEMGNLSIADNWGFYPVTPAETAAMARDLRPLVRPEAMLIAEDAAGQPIGFAIALPDVNVLLKGLNGRLLPLGWLKLLWGLPRLKQYRMWALGVAPAYQGKAVDALIYRRLYEALFDRQMRMEVNYVLEDNVRMNNALRNLGAVPLRRYRVYEMTIGDAGA
jgi:ribosomal protein S18 acetylase RimI-like enzyme